MSKEGEAHLILSTLSLHINELPLRIFFTSRPDAEIGNMFNSEQLLLKHTTRHLPLHEIPAHTAESDIVTFLQHRLARLQQKYPQLQTTTLLTENDIQSIALRSEGLFVFATTAVQYLEEMRDNDPKSHTQALIAEPTDSSSPKPPLYTHLDQLYLQVLRHALPESSNTTKVNQYRTVVGSIILLHTQVSVDVLAHFLGIDRSIVRGSLRDLHSVIIIPERNEDPIRLMHASFSDCLTQDSRCTDALFQIDASITHRFLAVCCFQQLRTLHRNMCGIEDPSKLDYETQDLDDLVASRISVPLRYACLHWADHFAQAAMSDDVLESLYDFCSEYSLYWLEVLGLLGKPYVAYASLNMAMYAVFVSTSTFIVERWLTPPCRN
jgi:hypothetical protein